VADVAGKAAGGVSGWVTDQVCNVVIDGAQVIDDVVYQVVAVGSWVDDRVEDAADCGGDVLETGGDVVEEVGRRIWDLWP
jgi:hypothetical protein